MTACAQLTESYADPERKALVNTYKIILRSGQTATVEDQRTLGALATQLANEGFVIVRRRASYSSDTAEVAYAERAVESIEYAPQ